MPDQEWVNATPYSADHAAIKSRRRAVGTARRIMEKPTDISIRRGSGTEFLDPQTVRIEARGQTFGLSTREGSNSYTYLRDIVVFGVRDHATLPDLDIQVNDRFGYNNHLYVVEGVTLHAGEIQAACTRYQP